MLQSKLIVLGVVVLAFLALGAAATIFYYKAKAAEGKVEVVETKLAASEAVVEQKNVNQKAVKKQAQSKQQDTEHMEIVEEEINELPGPHYLTREESQVAMDLARHFNCDGVQQVGSDCGKERRILPEASEAGLVSVESVFRAWGETIEFAHDLERNTRCYEDSMSEKKP